MVIKFYNTLSRSIEDFQPIKQGQVGIYHCGPTVYWNQHIGNLRANIIADIVNRVFIFNNYTTTLVRNYTDVGHLTGDNIGDADTGIDRMEKASLSEKLSPDEIANKYIKQYENDCAELNIIAPNWKPRATDHIPEMIEMVSQLLKDGYAYTTNLAVYFEVAKYDDYTKLSGQKLEMQNQGEGKGEVSDPDKKNPHDFALWFFRAGVHANAIQYWPSPFHSNLVENGNGFPGWHIECSAMSRKYLGSNFDIHMGGIEHIPIHHTNEIAQSVCANHEKYANYFIHNEHLTLNDERMSKSDGNIVLLSDIKSKGYSPIDLRYFYLQATYRSKQNFTFEALDASKTTLSKLRNFIDSVSGEGLVNENYIMLFNDLVSNDFNTPQGLAVIWELMKNPAISDADKKATILEMDKVLGLKLDKKVEIEIPSGVVDLLEQRKIARLNGDYALSDELRDKINSLGFEVKDTPEGQKVAKI